MSDLAAFLDFSADVTAFSAYELQGTGQAEAYLQTVVGIVGAPLVDDLLRRHATAKAQAADAADFEDRLRAEVFSDERLGPVARNLIKLWYVGMWYELPAAWRERFGAREGDQTFTVSAAAYTEGLLWPAMGANPPGAKAPGYGSWTKPPEIPPVEAG